MKCSRLNLERRLYPMVRCVGQMYGPFHHSPHNFLCYLYLPCAWYDDVLGMPTQNGLAYHIRWWKSLGSYCFLSEFLALGLQLWVWICYNLNWTKNIFLLGPQKMMRRPPYLTMLCSCLGTLLSASYILCLSCDCELSRQCLKSSVISSGLGSAL